MKDLLKRIGDHFRSEKALLALGKLLSNQQYLLPSTNINDFEFKIFSQSGDDGIIQYLIKHLPIKNECFIEFGVENYQESNTRFLMMNNHWRGFILDGSSRHMAHVRRQRWFWRYDLRCKAVFIDKDNINALMAESGFSDIGLLHIDIDGNDYHILETIDLARLNPSILSIEYNSNFGVERAITIPYDKTFYRTRAHYSNLYFGASLRALVHLANKRNYALVGGTSEGDNAYFVRRDLLSDKIKEVSVEAAYRPEKCRQGRLPNHQLSYLREEERKELLRGLPVVNVLEGKMETL